MTVKFNPNSLRDRLRQAAFRGVVRGTELVRDEAVSLILNTPKTGRVRRDGHVQSAPGEPPASDTGRLINSITTRYDADNLTGVVNVGAKHGLFLEYGTQKMEPRPFLRPALANKRQEVAALVQAEIQKELSKP